MPNTTNFNWVTPADSDLVKDGAAAIRTLGNGIDTSFVDLKGGTSGQILSKNSNTDLDFVWIANDQGDITAVTAGTGISGGGTSGAVTITNSMATEITASGDIIVGTGSGTFDNLPIGTTGQVLTADTTVSPYKVKWASAGAGFVGACQLTNSAPKTLTTGTSTIITFDTEKFDTDAFHSTVTNTGRITIPSGKGGKYLFTAKVVFQGNATGVRYGSFKKNGTTQYRIATLQTVTSGNPDVTAFTMSQVFDLVATDYIELVCLQTSGGNLNVLGLSDGDTEEVYFTAQFLGA